MRRFVACILFVLALLPASALAQSNVAIWCPVAGTQPLLWQPCNASNNLVTATNSTGTTTQAKVPIAVTNTYQQALASSTTRKGCTIQYIAVAGTKGFIFAGSAPGDTTTSFQLTNGQTFNCQTPGLTITDAIQVTGTATDIFVVSSQ
jgi:hypothetical protein